MEPNLNRHDILCAGLYGLLIVYASLFPFSGWQATGTPFAWLNGPLPHHISRKDVVVNILAYLPFGFLVSLSCISRGNRCAAGSRSLLAGFCLSLAMETLQTFLPVRQPSLVDLFANNIGAASGASLALLFTTAAAPGGALRCWQESWLKPGRCNSVGAAILFIWVLARLSPFVPSLQWSATLKMISSLWLQVHGKLPFHPAAAVVSCCYASGLALLAGAILRPDVKPLRLFAAAVTIVLTARLFIVNGTLTLEELLGCMIGIGSAVLLSRLAGDLPLFAAMAALATGFVLFELKPGGISPPFGQINWIPFCYHLDNMLAGIGLILEAVWPFSALSLLWVKRSRVSGERGIVYGGATVFLAVALLEWQQQYIPGRTADITQALLALGGWSWPLLLLKSGSGRL